jgi:hypothetical protein
MLRQLLFGGVISLGNIALHAVVTTGVVAAGRSASRWDQRRPQLWLTCVMIAAVGILMAAHLTEVMLWSLSYAVLDVAPPGTDLVYFAFVNYTTLGYGDILPNERWRLLGPMAAMNGVLLFGWSTAVIFEVLIQAVRRRDRRELVGSK